MHEALDGRTGRLAQLVAASDQHTGANLVAALRTNAARKGEHFGPMDGLFTSTAARELLAKRYGESRTWSASHFEAYALCPMRYYFEHVLRGRNRIRH
jgi:hypothetical protein